MKILGIGVDIVENKRIQKSIKNPLFKKRIYSFKELTQFADFDRFSRQNSYFFAIPRNLLV